MTKGRAVTIIKKGDKVRHTVLAISDEDTTAEQIKNDGWAFDSIEETVEIIERADDPAKDLIGTVRDIGKDGETAPSVKTAPDSWHDLDAHPDASWPDAMMVGAPIIGAVPGSPADNDAGRVGAHSPFIQRRKETEADVQGRIAQALQKAFREAPVADQIDASWLAGKVMDALEDDR